MPRPTRICLTIGSQTTQKIPSLLSDSPLYRNCAYCGRPFTGATSRRHFCSTPCKTAYWRLFTPKTQRSTNRPLANTPREEKSPSALVAALIGGKETIPAVYCKTCHSSLNPYERYEYCSPKCRQVMLKHLKSRLLAREAKRKNTGFTDPNNPNKEAALLFLRSLIQAEIDNINREITWAESAEPVNQ